MRKIWMALGYLFSLCIPAAHAQIAFENVSLLPMDGRSVVPAQTVLIEGERIIHIGTNIPLPETTIRIDGTGRYLMPGLTEMHGHVPPLNVIDRPQSEQAVKDTLFLYVANGVTTVRGMLGYDGQLALRDDPKWTSLPAPTLYLAGPSFNGRSVSSPENARRKVKDQAAEGWDLLKIHPGLTRNEYDAMARTAHAMGMDFGGHIPADVGLERALEFRQSSIDHIDGYIDYLDGATQPVSDQALVDIAIRTHEAGVSIVPTLAVWQSLLGAATLEDRLKFDEIRYIDARTLAGWFHFFTGDREIDFLKGSDPNIRHQNRLRLLKAMSDADVDILFGTDAPQVFSVPGFSIHREIASMREAGLSAEKILISATRAVGAHFKAQDNFGTVTEGYRADLILLSGNPLEDLNALKNPDGVMIRGQWLSRTDIDAGLAQIEARAKATQ